MFGLGYPELLTILGVLCCLGILAIVGIVVVVIVIRLFLKNKKQNSKPQQATVMDDPDANKIRDLIFQLGSNYAPAYSSVKSQLAIFGDRAIPYLLNFIHSNIGAIYLPISIERENKIEAVTTAIYLIGDLGIKYISNLEPFVNSQAPEWSKAALITIAKLRAKETSELRLDRNKPFNQINQIFSAYFYGHINLYPSDVLSNYCVETIEAMPNLEFKSVQERAQAWSMLGSLVFKAIKPKWGGAPYDVEPCPEAKKCYKEALRLASKPNSYWNELESKF